MTALLIGFVLLGLSAGIASGLIGIGGGIIIVPALIYLFSFSQHEAQGTTLALLILPVGIFAAVNYYKKGHVDIQVALFICVGFIVGTFFGSRIAVYLSNHVLKIIFGFALVSIGVYSLFKKKK